MTRTVRDFYSYIDRLAPFNTQAGNDNSGLNVGDFGAEVKNVCIALDATADVIREAAEKKAELIITHHPVIFDPLYSVKPGTTVYLLVKNSISVISAHTNFDVAKGGMSDILLTLAGFPTDGETINEIRDGSGYGRAVNLPEPITAEALAARIKAAYGCSVVNYTDGGKLINRVGICSGGGSNEIYNAERLKCDAFITGDVKWEHFVHAKNIGLTLIDAGHFHTENVMCEYLYKKIKADFTDISVFIAENNVDVCKYI